MGSFLDKIRSIFGAETIADIPDDIQGPQYNEPGGFFGFGGDYGYPYGGSGQDGSKFLHGLSSTGSSPILDNWFVRQNSRSAYHDSTAAHGIVTRWAQTVVGKGLKLESTPDFDTLGITPEQAEKWGREVNSAFHAWAKSKKSTRTETDNFYQYQKLAEIQKKRDGEYFTRFYRTRRRDLLNPLQLQFVDSSQVRGASYVSTYGFQANEGDGILRDKAGRETGYMVYQYDKAKKTFIPVTVPARGPKSGLTQMIHAFQPTYAGQGRGYSEMAHAIQEFENLTDFTVAHIKQAAIQASIALWVKPSDDEPASDPFEGITRQVAGPVDATLAPIPGGDPTETQPLTWRPMPEATLTTPGTVNVANLNSGEELQTLSKSSPVDSYRDFTEAFVSHLAASMGMPGEVLLMKFGQSYSASRALLVMYWRIVEMERDEMAADFLDPVFESWLEGEIAAGRISAPGWSDPRMRQAWLCNNWVGDPMPNIDPMRTAKADQMYVGMGAQTLNRVSRNLNGTEAKANMATLKKEFEMLPTPPWEQKNKPAGEDMGKPKQPDNDDKDDE